MKKKAKPATKTMTLDEVRKWKPGKAEREALKRLAAKPDDQIDTSDIPEITDFTGGVRGALYRPIKRPITIRLNAPDIAMAQELASEKGMPYQTYIRTLLHKALERERSATGSGKRRAPR